MSHRPPPPPAADEAGSSSTDPALIYANFNPAEWGPCSDDDVEAVPFMQFFGRCAMAATAVAVAGAFFYLLEVRQLHIVIIVDLQENKKWQRQKQRAAARMHRQHAAGGEAEVEEDEEEDDGVVHRLVAFAVKLYKMVQVERPTEVVCAHD